MKHLFITGIFRTGTSLITAALNAHNNIFVGWQPYLSFFKACRNKFFSEIVKKNIDPDYPMGILHVENDYERELMSNIFDIIDFSQSEVNEILNDIKQYLLAHEKEMNKKMKPKVLVNYLDAIQKGTAGEVFVQLLTRLSLVSREMNDDPTEIIGIKETFCEEFIEPILNYWRLRPFVIHVIRDLRAVVASRNYGKYFMETGTKYPLLFIIKSWKRSVAYHQFNRQKSRYMMIQYEDFVHNFEAIAKALCAMLDIRYSEKMIDVNKYHDREGNKWQPNTSFERLSRIDRASIDTWRSVLSPQEIEVIEFFCQKEMRDLGYQLETKQFDRARILGFHEDTDRSTDWLQKYNFNVQLEQSALTAL